MEGFSLEDLQAALQSAQEEKSAVSERHFTMLRDFIRLQQTAPCCDGRQAGVVTADQAVGQEHSRAGQQAAAMRISRR